MTEICLEKNVHYLFYGPKKIQFHIHFDELSKKEPYSESFTNEYHGALMCLFCKFILLKQKNWYNKVTPKESDVDSSFTFALTGSSGASENSASWDSEKRKLHPVDSN